MIDVSDLADPSTLPPDFVDLMRMSWRAPPRPPTRPDPGVPEKKGERPPPLPPLPPPPSTDPCPICEGVGWDFKEFAAWNPDRAAGIDDPVDYFRCVCRGGDGSYG